MDSDGPKEACIGWGPDPPCEEAIFRGKETPNDTVVSCAKMTEPIEKLHGLWVRVAAKELCIKWGSRYPYAEQFLGERACPTTLCREICKCKTAEQIEMPFRLWTPMCNKKHMLHVGAHLRNLANTIEPSVQVG